MNAVAERRAVALCLSALLAMLLASVAPTCVAQSQPAVEASEPLALWHSAAARGDLDAQFNLGLFGPRFGLAPEQAFRMLRDAALAQHRLACFALGTQFAERGDSDAAMGWLQCAARQGYAPAQYNLATLHARQRAVPYQLELARYWYAQAATSFAPAAAALAALAPAPSAHAAPAHPSRGPAPPFERAWIMARPATHFTLQVAAGRTPAPLVRMLELHQGALPSAWFLHRPRAREPYSAILGEFTTHAAAVTALAALPAPLLRNAPWVRRFGTLQRELATLGARGAADE